MQLTVAVFSGRFGLPQGDGIPQDSRMAVQCLVRVGHLPPLPLHSAVSSSIHVTLCQTRLSIQVTSLAAPLVTAQAAEKSDTMQETTRTLDSDKKQLSDIRGLPQLSDIRGLQILQRIHSDPKYQ